MKYAARGGPRRLDDAQRELGAMLVKRDDLEGGARLLVEKLALALSATLRVRHAPASVADVRAGSEASAGASTGRSRRESTAARSWTGLGPSDGGGTTSALQHA